MRRHVTSSGIGIKSLAPSSCAFLESATAYNSRAGRPAGLAAPSNDGPDKPDGDRQRASNDQTGKKIITDTAGEAGLRCRRLRHTRGHSLTRFLVEIAHGASLFHRDRFREVARLVDIGADCRSGMICN